MTNRRKGANPEKERSGTGRMLTLARRQQCATRPGKRDASTRGSGLIESDDNEHAVTMEIRMRCTGKHSLVSSLNNKERGASIRKSERPIRAEKSGNADRAKGPRYWDSEPMVNMPRHRADYAHDH
jgi:hypothetical protein